MKETTRHLYFGNWRNTSGICYRDSQTLVIKDIGFDGDIYYHNGDGRYSGPLEILPNGHTSWFDKNGKCIRVVTPEGEITNYEW